MKQRFLTTSHHVDKAADGLAHVTIQCDEMHGTRCSYCVWVAVQAAALLVACGNVQMEAGWAVRG